MSFFLPYIELPELVLIPAGALGGDTPALSIKPFGVLVAVGVYVGAWLALGYGARRGLVPRALGAFIVHVVLTGFVLGHVLDLAFYSPERLIHDPGSIFRLWEGLSSFGGFLGGALGALLFRWRYRTPVLPYADVVASGLPVGWLFGRAGCAVVHDHPGVASSSWFAVAYPEGPRLDLGLLEFVIMIPIAIAFYRLRKRAWPWGFFLAVLAAAYAPVRFILDFLRIPERVEIGAVTLLPDRRYFALTPAQWLSVALGGFGIALLVQVLRHRDAAAAYAAPRPPEAFGGDVSDANPQRRGRDTDEER